RRRTDDGGPARGAGPPFVCVLVVGGRGGWCLQSPAARGGSLPRDSADASGWQVPRFGAGGPARGPAASPGVRFGTSGQRRPLVFGGTSGRQRPLGLGWHERAAASPGARLMRAGGESPSGLR